MIKERHHTKGNDSTYSVSTYVDKLKYKKDVINKS